MPPISVISLHLLIPEVFMLSSIRVARYTSLRLIRSISTVLRSDVNVVSEEFEVVLRSLQQRIGEQEVQHEFGKRVLLYSPKGHPGRRRKGNSETQKERKDAASRTHRLLARRRISFS